MVFCYNETMNIEPNLNLDQTNEKSASELSEAEEILGSLPSKLSDFKDQISTEGHSVAQMLAAIRGDEWAEGYGEHPEVGGTSVEEHEDVARYNYGLVDLEYVVEQPEEYIIPECLPACKDLWGKNIDTVQCSNYGDKKLYIELGLLSDENKAILRELIEHNAVGYSFNGVNLVGGRNENRIEAKTPEELYELARAFVMQDVQEGEGFASVEDFLKEFRTSEELDKYGNVIELLDGQGYPNATLERALIALRKEHLYIPDEGRVYKNDFYLQKHNNYLKFKNPNKEGKNKQYID